MRVGGLPLGFVDHRARVGVAMTYRDRTLPARGVHFHSPLSD